MKTVKTYGLGREQRIRSAAEFTRIYELREKAGDRNLLVFAAPNERTFCRVGVSVSKRHGGAVKRNRLKRLLREAFRTAADRLPTGLDLILIPRQDSGSGLADYQRSLLRLAGGLAQRLAKKARP